MTTSRCVPRGCAAHDARIPSKMAHVEWKDPLLNSIMNLDPGGAGLAFIHRLRFAKPNQMDAVKRDIVLG